MPRKSKNAPELYTEEQAKALESFIEKQFGKIESFLEQKEPDMIKLKFLLVPPDMKRHHYTVVTSGMGAHLIRNRFMDKDIENRYELVMMLPPGWNVHGFSEDEFWPFLLMDIISKMPIKDKKFISWGHTIQFDQKFAPSVPFSGAILANAGEDDSELYCELDDSHKIRFLQVIPLYEREVEYWNKTGSELFEKLPKPMGLVDTERECVISEDYADIIDCVSTHSSKVVKKELDTPEINGANHIAAYLRWMILHDMVNEEFTDFFAEELDDIRSGKLDARDFLVNSLGGELNTELFTETGQLFTMIYYDFYGKYETESYPGNVDDMALAYFGSEKYNCEEFGDEAYLFVPYNEEYHAAMCSYIDKAYADFSKAKELTEKAAEMKNR